MQDKIELNSMELKECINRKVIFETKDGEKHEGSLYTVDPVSESVVILNKIGGKVVMKIIFKHAIAKVLNIGEMNPIKMWEEEEQDVRNLSETRGRLKDWLTKNLIPIEESGECLKIGGQLTINPPYGKNNCISSNEMVLSKIQKLIERMPFFE